MHPASIRSEPFAPTEVSKEYTIVSLSYFHLKKIPAECVLVKRTHWFYYSSPIHRLL